MNRAIRSMTAFGLTLACGAALGIGLQRYLGMGDQASANSPTLLQKLGLDRAIPSRAADVEPIISAVPERLQGKLKLYVLVGQSNMVGTAEIPAGLTTSANVFTFGNDYRWAVGQEPVDSPIGQVDQISKDANTGFGPAFTFAKTLVQQDSNQLIGLIPCAREGSSITDWQKSPSDQTLYGSCLKRIRAASPMGTVSGMLFFQGEADTIDPQKYPALRPDADAWAEKFATFVYNFRNDVGNPELPLVYAQLGQPQDLEGLPNWSQVQQQQANIQLANAAMIETSDLPMKGLAFTADSYKVIGQRFAAAMTALNATTPAENIDGGSPPPEAAQ
jgi:hypothetical protein